MSTKVVEEKDIIEIVNKCNSDSSRLDAVNDAFLGEFPEDEVMKRCIEGELMHPSGVGSLIDLQNCLETCCRNWCSENIVDYGEVEDEEASKWLKEFREDIVRKQERKFFDEIYNRVEDIYIDIIKEDISDKDSENIHSVGDEINNLIENEKHRNISRKEISNIVEKRFN